MTNNINDDILRNFGGTSKNSLNHLMETGNENMHEISTESYSPYKTADQIPQYFEKDKNFCVMTLNCQSINAKFDKLKTMIKYLKEKNFIINAIILQETWISGASPDFSLFHLPGYGDPISLGATCGRHGGLAIYLTEGLNHKIIAKSSSTTKLWEGLFISVTGDNLTKPLIIGNVYKPPRDNNNNKNIDAFMKEFMPVISKIGRLKSDAIILGDTNIDLLQINNREKYAEYLDFMLSSGFFPKISFPTKFSNLNASLYDHIFYKSSQSNYKTQSAILWSALSDHLACITTIKHIRVKPPAPRYVRIGKSDENSINNFINDLQSHEIYQKLNKDLLTDPNINYSILEKIIDECRKNTSL